MGRTICLVSCVSKKRDLRLPATDLYCSPWFLKARAYAERVSDLWFLLSAEYGLLLPETVISPYEKTLLRVRVEDRKSWADGVVAGLRRFLRSDDTLVILAGKRYREFLVGPLQSLCQEIQIPMEGLEIGKQLKWLSSQPQLVPKIRSLVVFYDLLKELEERLGGMRTLDSCSSKSGWPRRGVYFFFEEGEQRTSSGSGPRVIRVGTHAVSTGSKATLWHRLRNHRGDVRSGGGHHRGSVFRLQIGAALLRRFPDRFTAPCWGKGSSAPRDVRAQERELEIAVSQHVRKMPFLWVGADDEPGPSSVRCFVEKNAIALLSNFNAGDGAALDPLSSNWLGSSCPSEKMRQSGLWNADSVSADYDSAFLHTLERLVTTTEPRTTTRA